MNWRETPLPVAPGTVPMQQHGHYGRACAALGSPVVSLTCGPAHAPVATAQVLIRKWPLFGNFALLARGPVWHARMDEEEHRRLGRDLCLGLREACRGVIATPELGNGADPWQGCGMLPIYSAGTIARLPLTGGPDARLARQHGKWRNRLRRAQETDLSILSSTLPVDPDHWLLLKEEAQARRRGYRRLPKQFTLAWARENGRKSTRLFTACLKGEPVAAMLFLLHGKSASYHVGWAGVEGRFANAHTLLLWEAGNWLAAQGHDWVDLGTLDTESTPGLARFKLGAGAEPIRLGQSWLDAPGNGLIAGLFGHGHRAAAQMERGGTQPSRP